MSIYRRSILAATLGLIVSGLALIAVRIAKGEYSHAQFDAYLLYPVVVVAVHAAFWTERK